MTGRSIMQEALADTKEIKKAAEENAKNLVMEQFQDQIRDVVESQLNQQGDNKSKMSKKTKKTLKEEEDLEVEESEMDEEGEEDAESLASGLEDDESGEEDAGDLEEGLSEKDLDEALNAALAELDYPDLGEQEFVDPKQRADGRGLADDETSNDKEGWENKHTKQAHDYYKSGGFPDTEKDVQKESKDLKKRVIKLAKENQILRRANEKYKESLEETRLFNNKVLYATKLLQTEGLDKKTKTRILEHMDGAGSTQEVKTIYETWKTALQTMSEARASVQNASQGKKKATSLQEALGSQPQQGTGKGVSEVDTTHMLSEEEQLEADPSGLFSEGNKYNVNRLQSLAGIKAD